MTIRYSAYDTRDSVLQGNKAESLFALCAKNRNWQVHKSSRWQDMKLHFDYRISKADASYLVDVKAAKRVNNEINYDYIWLEMRGTTGQGWLYVGNADLIAFQLRNEFIFIERLKLASWATEHIDLNKTITSRRCTDHLNALQIGYYRRWDRSDILSLVYVKKLEPIIFGKWSF